MKNVVAIIGVDYDEFIEGSYRGTIVTIDNKIAKRFKKGIIADYKAACEYAKKHAAIVMLSSTCNHFITDNNLTWK